MLLVPGCFPHFVANVVNHLVDADKPVPVSRLLNVVGVSVQRPQEEIGERAVPAAEPRALNRIFFRAARQKTEQVSFFLKQLFHVPVDGVALDGADHSGPAHVDINQHPADLAQLIPHQRLDVGHRQSRAGQILRVAVVGDDEGLRAVGGLGHRAVGGQKQNDRVVFPRPGP